MNAKLIPTGSMANENENIYAMNSIFGNAHCSIIQDLSAL